MGVGLSVLIGLKSATLFMIFVYLRTLRFALLSVPFLYASLVSLLVSLASHPSINLPMLLGKNTDGSFPIWSLIMFSPYLYFVRGFSALRRLKSKEAPYSEVSKGLYVGGWPSSTEKMPPGNPAVIDCTCELPRVFSVSGNGYLCVPTWDTRSPDPGAIESAVKWAWRKRTQNIPIFIHCAYGHGRSVAVMCALLVALGVVDDWKSAERFIRDKRPYIRMNALHRKALEEWSKNRLSPPKTGVVTSEFYSTTPECIPVKFLRGILFLPFVLVKLKPIQNLKEDGFVFILLEFLVHICYVLPHFVDVKFGCD